MNDDLTKRLDAIKEKDYFEFDSEVSKDEQVLGRATPRIMQLFTLLDRRQEEMRQALLEGESKRDRLERQRILKEVVDPLDAECELLRRLFWEEMERKFPPPEYGSLGIRKGNIVVHSSKPNPFHPPRNS